MSRFVVCILASKSDVSYCDVEVEAEDEEAAKAEASRIVETGSEKLDWRIARDPLVIPALERLGFITAVTEKST